MTEKDMPKNLAQSSAGPCEKESPSVSMKFDELVIPKRDNLYSTDPPAPRISMRG